MGTSALTIALTAGLLLAGPVAHAQGHGGGRDSGSGSGDPACTGVDAQGRPFPACFDPGNRLLLEASTRGYGGELRLRHRVPTEPGVWWRLEHRMIAVQASAARLRGVLYQGRYLRHARDGHIVVPFRPTTKLFVPFDVGAEAEVGRIDWRRAGDAEGTVALDAVRMALLFELTRASHARRRLAVGVIARWGMRLDEDIAAVRDHRVEPFSRALLDAYVESRSGLTLAGLRVEAGTTWSSQAGWQSGLTAEARLERVLVAVNDRPLSVHLAGGYESRSAGWHGALGLRLALSR